MKKSTIVLLSSILILFFLMYWKTALTVAVYVAAYHLALKLSGSLNK